jgi:hypothetical protein
MRAHLAVLLLAVSSTARAADLRGSFSTMLAGRQDPRAGDAVSVVPVYELVSLDAANLGVPYTDDSRVVLNGWGRLQLGKDELAGNEADLNLLYFDVRKGPARIRLGRQHLVLGVGRMDLIDGLDARIDAGFGLSAEAFAGFTVHPELKIRTNNWEGGGRLAYNLQAFHRAGELGLSYVQRREDGEVFRNDVGADAYTVLGPTRWVAMAVMSPETAQLIEARANAFVSPCDCLTLGVEAERVAPALMVPLNSIFSVFADTPHDAFGAEATWSPNPYWSATASGARLLLDQAYLGYRASLSAATYRDPSHRSAIGLEARSVKESDNGYVRGRLFSYLQLIDPLRVAADLYVMRFDKAVNAVSTSTIGQASVTYDFTKTIRVAATIAGGVTPWAKFQVESMLRLAYGYDVDFGREVAP